MLVKYRSNVLVIKTRHGDTILSNFISSSTLVYQTLSELSILLKLSTIHLMQNKLPTYEAFQTLLEFKIL